MMADVTSAVRVPDIETHGHLSSTVTTSTKLIRDKKGSRRALDLIVAAGAVTVVAYLALLCHRRLRATKSDLSRKLATRELEDDCFDRYSDPSFPSFDDKFVTFKPEKPLDSGDVPRGPPRQGGLISECYREKHRIPVLRYKKAGDALWSQGRSSGYVTDKANSTEDDCVDLSTGQSCPASVIVPTTEEVDYKKYAIGCYPSWRDTQGYLGNDAATNLGSPELSCPLKSIRQRASINGDQLDPGRGWDCVFHKPCGGDQFMVVRTADPNQVVTVASTHQGTYHTYGRGLYTLECLTVKQILLQLARQDINSLIEGVNTVMRFRYNPTQDVNGTSECNFVNREAQRLNNNIKRLFKARDNVSLVQQLETAWRQGPQGNAPDELTQVVLSLKRAKEKFENEARFLQFKLIAVKIDDQVRDLLAKYQIEKKDNITVRTTKIKTIAGQAHYHAHQAQRLTQEVAPSIGRGWHLTRNNQAHTAINPNLTTVDDKLVRRCVHRRNAHRLLKVLRDQLRQEKEQMTTAQTLQNWTEVRLRDADINPYVTAAAQEVEEVIYSQCKVRYSIAPQRVPLVLSIAHPFLALSLILMFLLFVWRKKQTPLQIKDKETYYDGG